MNKGEKKNLNRLFEPRTIAVIGASADESKIGNIVLTNLEKFQFAGQIYLVNHNGGKIGGKRCYESFSALPKTPDLAIIATPAETIPELLLQIGEKGTKNAIVFAAGFKETGALGEKLENKVTELAKKFQINLLGPNCLGLLNTEKKLNATFGQVPRGQGTIRFASQSGALATSLFDWAESAGLGFREFVTLGNKAVLNENDLLSYWKNDGDNAPLGLYLESILDGQQFVSLANSLSRRRPVVLLKPGKSVAAAAAMRSHTGAMAGDNDVLEAALKQAGVVRAEGVEDLFDLLKVFAWEKAPEGPNVAIVSNAGGASVVATDAVESAGLRLAEIPAHVTRLLSKYLPRAASIHNPIDVLGDALASRYQKALEAVLKEPVVQSVLVILTPQAMTQIEETAEVIVGLSRRYKKPIVCSFMGGAHVASGEQILNTAKIPSFRFPERAVAALGKMWRWREWQKDPTKLLEYTPALMHKDNLARATSIVTRALVKGQTALSSFESNAVMKAAGLTVPSFDIVTGLNDAKKFAARHGFPLVLKISSSNIIHKTDVHGVINRIKDEEELAAAYAKMVNVQKRVQARGMDGQILIQHHVPEGIEVIVGIKNDVNFGRVLFLGAGGTFTELLRDKNLYRLPVNKKIVQRLLDSSRVGQMLSGLRNQKPYAKEKLVETIVHFCALSEQLPVIKELEINPVIVTHHEAFAIDAKILL